MKSMRNLSRGACAALCLAIGITSVTWAGNNGRVAAVGGVSINAQGVVGQVDAQTHKELRELRLKNLQPVPAGLNQPVELRKISLRAIEQAVTASGKSLAAELPDEIRFLAGIQRIQYVFIYPEQNDIVLAGPGEGWKVDDSGSYVGVTTGRPVLRLEDLVVALRTVENARQGGISVSIDPTAEGRQQFERYMSTQKTFNPAVLGGIEKALGQQQISIKGIPATSHFASVLVASDVRMKRIAMKLEASPVKGLPSFLDMLQKGGKLDNMMPRWWLACNYEPLAKSEDGLAWELRGTGVKVMTEEEVINADGSVTGTGKVDPLAQEFSNLMTEKYDELSTKEPIFGELRNMMDLCVIAALISKESLFEKASLKLPTLLGENDKLQLFAGHAPQTVATQCSFVERSREFLITASGGVDITSWQVADKSVTNQAVGKVRGQAAAKAPGSMWWN